MAEREVKTPIVAVKLEEPDMEAVAAAMLEECWQAPIPVITALAAAAAARDLPTSRFKFGRRWHKWRISHSRNQYAIK
jgi:endonuclease V-like protein UPF0215 family